MGKLENKTVDFIKIIELDDKCQEQENIASELLRTAQDRHNDEEIEIEREGKKVKVKEKTLWQEVWHLGTKCEAANELRKKHPEVFEAYDKQDKYAQELKAVVFEELGIDHTKLRISDFIRITEEMVKYYLNKNDENNQGHSD